MLTRKDILRFKFMELCWIFLYSGNKQKEDKAFKLIARDYLNYIIYSNDNVIALSIFEKVVKKVFDESENSKTGEKYEKFVSLLTVLAKLKTTRGHFGGYKSILMKYLIQMKNNEMTEQRNKFIKKTCGNNLILFL